MAIVTYTFKPSPKSLPKKSKEWLITELLLMYEFVGLQTQHIEKFNQSPIDCQGIDLNNKKGKIS